jgi:hypothetical protein
VRINPQRNISARGRNYPCLASVDFVLLAAIWGASFLFMRFGHHEFGAHADQPPMRVAVAAVPAAADAAARPGPALPPALEGRLA